MRFSLACLLHPLATTLPASAARFTVAPNSSDTADGSAAHPFATVERARDAVRAARQRGEGAEVVLPGTSGQRESRPYVAAQEPARA